MSHVFQFYVEPHNVQTSRICLQDAEFRHAVRVLRRKNGDPIIAVDGKGNRYYTHIADIQENCLYADIDRREWNDDEFGFSLYLAVGMPRGQIFDWVVEKGTEIGVTGFMPVRTKYSLSHVDSKIDRWRKMALSAMKQSGRARLPEIMNIFDFKDSFKRFQDCAMYIAHEFSGKCEQSPLLINNEQNVVLYIGPESGFTQEELLYACRLGAQNLGLGPFRLRTETAALAGAIKLLAMAGRMG
ncbi:16S rRNA (uracil(1498)-N(3))-methyltransferase [candidate division KSB1 bacterium]|nr:16S rRNA (uracil(1498)-N(3))-methyltransferase [candidate division KSB1 bacterium]